MIWPRWLARFAAWFAGYFWERCPACGRPYAGFESGDGVVFRPDIDAAGDGSIRSFITCKRRGCRELAHAMNKQALGDQTRYLTLTNGDGDIVMAWLKDSSGAREFLHQYEHLAGKDMDAVKEHGL